MIAVQVQVPVAAATAAQPGEARDAGAPEGTAPTEDATFAVLFAGLLPGLPGAVLPPPAEAQAPVPSTQSGGEPPAALPDPARDAAAAIEHALAVAVAVVPTDYAPPGAARSRVGAEPRKALEPSRAGTAPVRGNAKAGTDEAFSDARSAPPSAIARDPFLALPAAEAGTRTVPPVADPLLSTPQTTQAAPSAQLPEVPAQPTLRTTLAAAPAMPSPLRIESPLGTPSWRDELAGSVSILVRNATSEAQIRVTPAELGPVYARISVDGGTASVVFSAPTQEVRDALEGSLGALRERLAESGLTLGEASVSGEPASRFANRDHRKSPEDGRGALPDGATPSAEPVRGLRRDGLIDLYA